MADEIERKFLVTGDGWRQNGGERTLQGYLCRDPARTVRIRVGGGKARLTIKGVTEGIKRPEFEYEIPLDDAGVMLRMVDGPLVDKIRHYPRVGAHTWHVDEFLGDNAGLVVAEIELEREDEPFERPAWLGLEVTRDWRYANSNLVTRPYSEWKDTIA